jgi:hypothetical protein
MLLRRGPHSLYQRNRLVEWKPLRFAVMRNLRQALVYQLGAATVE